MKYKFIIDEPLLDGQFVSLSETEMDIVIATVIGNYSLLLKGFQTERIVKAIRLLRDYNKPFVTICKDCTDRELIGENCGDFVKSGLVTEADGGYLYTKDLGSLNVSVTSWLCTVMFNTWIKLRHSFNTVTLPARFKLIAEVKERNGGVSDFNRICEMCDIHYNCKEEERREIHSIGYLKEKIKKINEFSKDFDCDAIRFAKRAESSIPMFEYKDNTIRLAKTLSIIKGYNIVVYDILESAYKLTN